MRTVITYGTYDLLHDGHLRLLERAKALGDRLIVGVTSDSYDRARGKLNVVQSLAERIENIKQTGLADEVIVEEYDGQKIHDIQRLNVDVFAIGSDWLGKWDHLKDYCEVVYLERTRGISSTELRDETFGILRLGLVGAGRNARQMVEEARYVSGVSVEAVWDKNFKKAAKLQNRMELETATSFLEELAGRVDAVYISAPFPHRKGLIEEAINAGKHVLAEPPIALSAAEYDALYSLANTKGVALIEGVRTAFSPGFQRMVAYAQSGSIGEIRSVQISSTRLTAKKRAHRQPYGGALNTFATYPLFAVTKLLGTNYRDLSSQMWIPDGASVDLFTRVDLQYEHALASVSLGIGVASDNAMVISGTRGYLTVPAPWWRTDHYVVHHQDSRGDRQFFIPFEGTGQRYELVELLSRAHGRDEAPYRMYDSEAKQTAAMIDIARETAHRFG